MVEFDLIRRNCSAIGVNTQTRYSQVLSVLSKHAFFHHKAHHIALQIQQVENEIIPMVPICYIQKYHDCHSG